MKIINQTKGTVIAEKAFVANTFFSRMKGLLGRKTLAADEALWIKQCNSIHMFFMKFPIDAIFIDANNRVVGLVERIRPFQLSPCFFKAADVIECAAGTIAATRTGLGDVIYCGATR